MVFRVAARVPEGDDTSAEVVDRWFGKPSDICDIGCGAGVMIRELARRGHRVVGVEPNRKARDVGNRQGIEFVD